MRRDERTTARAPSGVAWPTVSAMQMREAPASIAVVNSRRSVSGSERVVSSVTYITAQPLRARQSRPLPRCSAAGDRRVQSSAYWRIGLDPMKQQHSIGRPVRWTMSAIGWMSAIDRARGAVGLDPQTATRRSSRASVSTSRDDVRTGAGQADVGGIDADLIEQVQDAQLLVDRRARTDGDCSPSRSVSSLRITIGGRGGGWSWFQS